MAEKRQLLNFHRHMRDKNGCIEIELIVSNGKKHELFISELIFFITFLFYLHVLCLTKAHLIALNKIFPHV